MHAYEQDLFSSAQSRETGRRLKAEGLSQVGGYPNDSWVCQARDKAVEIALHFGEVDADRLRAVFPPPLDASKNIMGPVFTDKRLRFIRYKTSTRTSSRGRRLGVYGVREPIQGDA